MPEICITCGRRAGERPIRKLPLAMSPDLGLCVSCDVTLGRKGVQSGIQRESDRILSTDKSAFLPYLPQPTCRHCGSPVLMDTQGREPLWCATCERERMQLATGVR